MTGRIRWRRELSAAEKRQRNRLRDRKRRGGRGYDGVPDEQIWAAWQADAAAAEAEMAGLPPPYAGGACLRCPSCRWRARLDGPVRRSYPRHWLRKHWPAIAAEWVRRESDPNPVPPALRNPPPARGLYQDWPLP